MAHCGATNRKGEPCKRHAVVGSKRCKLHGGNNKPAKRGNKHAATPGSVYSQFLTDDERAASDHVDLDSLDAEIKLATIRLMRALKRESEKADEPELDERTERDVAEHVGARSEEKYKVRDYSALIDRLTARVESLKAKRTDALLKRRADDRAAELHALEIERRRKEAAITNGQITNNIMPVPTADSVDSWEQVASEQQNKALGR
jgi:hypothetical protein